MHHLLLLVTFLLPLSLAAQVEIHLSPTGKDSANGTQRTPVASLERANELVREKLKLHPSGAIHVVLAPGDYPVLETLQIGPSESGQANAPVVWRAAQPGLARIIGARAIDTKLLRPVADPALIARIAPEAKGQIQVIDLSTLNLTHTKRLPDWSRDTVDLFALFFDDQRLPLARWPNGEYGYTTMKRVLNSGSFSSNSPEGGTFEYHEDRPARWQAAIKENGVWVRGFWRVPWGAETIRVRSIDTAARTITLASSTPSGIGSKYSKLVDGTRVGDGKEPWFALNLLEEIDEPGEWSVDFNRNKLYIWPPVGKGRLLIADHSDPIVAFAGAEHVSFQGIVFTHNMGVGVSIANGRSVQLFGCRVQNILRRGVLIRGGFNHVVQSCDITDIGLAAIDLLGGDRATLTPSGHQIVNNHIWNAALLAPVPAIIAGLDARNQQLVGARIAQNRVHDVSYSAIHFGGNDNILENNEFYRLGLDGGDLGGFYTTGGWTSYGNVVRHNFIHHAENANAIYMDDGGSGLLAEDNVIYRAESGIFIGGGHDHIVRRNLIVRSKRAVHVDARGLEPARNYSPQDPRLSGDLKSVPYTSSPWKERFPTLLTLLQHDTRIPRGNLISDNVFVDCASYIRRSGRPEKLVGFTFQNNAELPATDLFTNAEALDLTLRDPANPAFKTIARFDLARYGIRIDKYRSSVPNRDLETLQTGDTKRRAFDSNKDVESYKR